MAGDSGDARGLTGPTESLGGEVRRLRLVFYPLIDLAATERDRQRMAVGECVNLASRLQSLAEPGQILVGPSCHSATEYVAEFGPSQLLRPKGFDEVTAWPLVRVAGGGRSKII